MAKVDVGFRSERGPILLAIMLSTALIALDATILATAVPSIVDDLGGFDSFPWLFSVYLLAYAVTVPVYAKLADTIGRKPIMLFGIAVFLLGSLLCGVAWDMASLIAFRLVQGIGAGAIQPMTITLAGDLYSIEERAKVQGYLASVWGMSAVFGPTVGGIFSQLDAWRGIFFVNVPFCLLAGYMIIRHLRENVERRRHRIDVAGAILLTGATSLLMLGVLEGGRAWAWDSPTSLALFGCGAAALVVFALVERRAREPVLPVKLLTRRIVLTACLLAFAIGSALVGLTAFVPTYLEKSLGTPPILAGLSLAALNIGWPISASLAGRIYLRIGFRSTIAIGTSLVIAGTSTLAAFASTPAVPIVTAGCFLIGLGFGLCAAPSLIWTQSIVEWGERGVVTGANMFLRSMGSALGAAVLGAIANAVIAARGGDENDPETITAAVGAVFLGAVGVAVFMLIMALSMPRDRGRPVAPPPDPGVSTGPVATL